jgi:hypothetical protein|tara:strand:- start:15 stop:200 length:186 start_codon:yes stop_codon:yes gene_type:complete
MSKFIFMSDAILSLNANAKFVVRDDKDKDNYTVEWFEETTPISKSDIETERARLQAIEDAK